jgi:hypothetical protein
VHFHTPVRGVVSRDVLEGREVEVRAQFPIDTRQEIQIERGGDPDGIIVSRE